MSSRKPQTGYIVAGKSQGDVVVLKLNRNGDVQWQKTFGEIHYFYAGVRIQQNLRWGLCSWNDLLLLLFPRLGVEA
jgi:hypothetical protein